MRSVSATAPMFIPPFWTASRACLLKNRALSFHCKACYERMLALAQCRFIARPETMPNPPQPGRRSALLFPYHCRPSRRSNWEHSCRSWTGPIRHWDGWIDFPHFCRTRNCSCTCTFARRRFCPPRLRALSPPSPICFCLRMRAHRAFRRTMCERSRTMWQPCNTDWSVCAMAFRSRCA